MTLKDRLTRLEGGSVPAGACPECGNRPDAVRKMFYTVHGRGEPVAWYYQKGWPDYRPDEYFPYPPDPRPLCPVCGLPDGPLLILTGLYEGESMPDGRPVQPRRFRFIPRAGSDPKEFPTLGTWIEVGDDPQLHEGDGKAGPAAPIDT
jgi:hypothetical protein